MKRRRFKLTLPDDTVRKMNRKQYRAASSYLRLLTRLITKHKSYDKLYQRASDVMVHGTSTL